MALSTFSEMVRRITKAWQEGKRPRRMVSRATVSLATGTNFATMPTDFLGPISLAITDETPTLEYYSLENFNRERHRLGDDATGTPRFYTVSGTTFIVYPEPDETYSARLFYWAKPAALSDSDPTNWILQYHPDVYLYGALTQAGPYLDDPRVTTWATLFATGLDDLINSDPLPTDNTPLRVDSGLLLNGGALFDINSGDF
jgi:hypothetical protein